jgi:magnesium chelatase family protein
LSGPLLDRFDMHCAVPPVEMGLLSGTCVTESSGEVRERVAAARAFQSQFQLTMLGYTRTNAELTLNELERLSPLDGESRRLLHTAGQQLGLSARAYVRIVRVARTIADLQLSSSIVIEHVAEATQARLIDRQHATPT